MNNLKALQMSVLGIYIYTCIENRKVLYVGEGIIIDRLIRHYKKSYLSKPQIPRDIFFNAQEQKKKLLVYYIEIPDPYDRKAIEALLLKQQKSY